MLEGGGGERDGGRGGGQSSCELSPPDVGGLGVFLLGRGSGLCAVASGSLIAAAWVSAEACLTSFVLVALPRGARVLRLQVRGQEVAVVLLRGGAGGGRLQGGAEAEAVAQSAPVLLALQPDAPRQRLLHLLAAAQENVHELHVWTGQKEREKERGEVGYSHKP